MPRRIVTRISKHILALYNSNTISNKRNSSDWNAGDGGGYGELDAF